MYTPLYVLHFHMVEPHVDYQRQVRPRLQALQIGDLDMMPTTYDLMLYEVVLGNESSRQPRADIQSAYQPFHPLVPASLAAIVSRAVLEHADKNETSFVNQPTPLVDITW